MSTPSKCMLMFIENIKHRKVLWRITSIILSTRTWKFWLEHFVKVKLIGNYSQNSVQFFVSSESVVLSLCKIKRLNSNFFVSDFDICRFYFPPGSPYSSSLYCAVFHYWDLWFLRRASKSRVTALCSAFVGAASDSQITKKSIIIQK